MASKYGLLSIFILQTITESVSTNIVEGTECLLYYLQDIVKQFCIQLLHASILSTGLPFENITCGADSGALI